MKYFHIYLQLSNSKLAASRICDYSSASELVTAIAELKPTKQKKHPKNPNQPRSKCRTLH